MRNATAEDYFWLEDTHSDLTEAYCLTVVQGLSPKEVLRRLDATRLETVTGVTRLGELAHEAWQTHHGDALFVGVAAVGDWAVMIEMNGYLGSLDEVIGPLSAGTRAVSHFRNVNAVDRFAWWADRDQRLGFEPLFAHDCWGSAAKESQPLLQEVGFELSEDGDGSDEPTAASFALAERLTGVRITPELLDGTESLSGLAPVRR